MRTEGIRLVCPGLVYFTMQVKTDISPVCTQVIKMKYENIILREYLVCFSTRILQINDYLCDIYINYP